MLFLQLFAEVVSVATSHTDIKLHSALIFVQYYEISIKKAIWKKQKPLDFKHECPPCEECQKHNSLLLSLITERWTQDSISFILTSVPVMFGKLQSLKASNIQSWQVWQELVSFKLRLCLCVLQILEILPEKPSVHSVRFNSGFLNVDWDVKEKPAPKRRWDVLLSFSFVDISRTKAVCEILFHMDLWHGQGFCLLSKHS